jgi:methyl-accepting chemotaxis protein
MTSGNKKEQGVFKTNLVTKLKQLINSEIYTHLSGMPIQSRLILVFLLVSVVPIGLMGLISYNISKGAITSKISKYSVRELTQTVNNLDLVLKKNDDFSIQLIASKEYSGLIEKLSENLSNLDYFQLDRKLEDYFQSYFPLDKVTVVFCPANTDKVVYTGDDIGVDMFRKTALFKNVKNNTIWDYYQNNIVFLKDLKSVDTGTSYGTLAIFIKETNLDQIINANLYKEANFSKERITNFPYSIAVNKKGEILISPFPEDLGKNITSLFRNPKIMEQITSGENDTKLNERVKNKDVLVTFNYIEKKDWYLLDIAPNSYLYSETTIVGITALIIGLLMSAMVVFISFVVALGISNPLNKVMQAMKQAENGDLSVTVNIHNQDELGQLGRSFNLMIVKIHELIVNTKNTVAEVVNHSKVLEDSSTHSAQTAEVVAAAIEEISRGTMEQTQEAEKTAQKMSELAKQIEVVVSKSNEIEQITELARGMSLQSKEAIQQLMQKSNETDNITNTVIKDIHELNSSAEEIGNLTEIITNIAEQTNLLGLNASIEAARAGEMGQGFAVVAEEVNKLAAQSQIAAKTINSILKRIQSKTTISTQTASQAHQIVEEQQGVVQNAQQSFDEVINAMDNVVQRMSYVNENIKKINAVKEDTLSSILNISAISEEAAASFQEVNASSEEQTAIAEQVSSLARDLLKMSDKLANNIAKFKVDSEVSNGPSNQ